MKELREKIDDYFSGPGFWPFFVMMVMLFLPSVVAAIIYL